MKESTAALAITIRKVDFGSFFLVYYTDAKKYYSFKLDHTYMTYE